MERQKKLYDEILEKPLTNLEEGILVRGGDLGKLGPGAQAKADPLKNARKTGVGSLFAQGFTTQRQYCSRPMNKALSCRNNVKMNEDQFNGNQTNKGCALTKELRRNLPHADDVIIPNQGVVIRHGQSKYKVKNHGYDFNLPCKPNEKGRLKTPRISENIEIFKNEIKKLVLSGEKIEGTYRKGEADELSVIHFYDKARGCNAIFKQKTKEIKYINFFKLAGVL